MLQLLGLIFFVVVFLFKVFSYVVITSIFFLLSGGIFPLLFFFGFFSFINYISNRNNDKLKQDTRDGLKRAARKHNKRKEDREGKDKNLFVPNEDNDIDRED